MALRQIILNFLRRRELAEAERRMKSDMAAIMAQGAATRAEINVIRDSVMARTSKTRAYLARSEKYQWRGPGPEPASWWHEDGTKVYRSYGDYVDD